MPRAPRGIEMDKRGVYHLRGQAAGPKGYRPLREEAAARELIAIIRHYVGLYFCQAAAFEIMGTHYHLPVCFESYRELDRQTLWDLAERFYSSGYRPHRLWGPKEWRVFNRRVFNVSELMRNIQQAFTRWYNHRHHRKGSFWAGRFQSTDSQDLEETVYYVELNAVRAGLVSLPEQWPHSSAWMRKRGMDAWLMPLATLLETNDPGWAKKVYRVKLYWRGTKASKETDAVIPIKLAQQMEREQFPRGCYLERHEAFSRGRMIGSFEYVQANLDKWRETRIYRRRRFPIALGVGNLYALRSQRKSYLRI